MDDQYKQWKGPARVPTPEEMADRHARAQLAQIYALGMDMRDFELASSSLVRDAVGMGKECAEPTEQYLSRGGELQAYENEVADHLYHQRKTLVEVSATEDSDKS